jgi:hypothetical protein
MPPAIWKAHRDTHLLEQEAACEDKKYQHE